MHHRVNAAITALLYWLRKSLIIQLMLTVAVMPFLIFWRLPYTPLSLLGNLIYPLFLIPFLGVSSMLFFATIFGLPTHWLCIALTSVQRCWLWALSIRTPACWIGLSWHHFAFCIGTVSIVWAYKKGFSRHTLGVAGIGIALFCNPLLERPSPPLTQLVRGEHTLTCWPLSNGMLQLIDHGYISKAANTDSVIDYEVMPHIIATYGQPTRIKIGAHRAGKRLKNAQNIMGEWGVDATT